ncbi:polymorphic toxin-type HINT domain-containing protein, partial [Leptospira weilii]|uniref:polymorphic toxin-type HINT domain-containing protein n=1 Tax=Leptospira weilii TaxID=28184 RepID=UPI000AFD9558
NFLADKWKADFVSGKAKEDAEAQAKQREAQNRTGADVLNGAGYASAEDKLNAARKEALIHEMQDSGQDASKILDMSDADIAKELQKRGRSGDTNGNFGINEQGSSRTSILDHVLGSAKDFLVNNFTTGGASDQYGYVGSDGKYHQNVCFTAGTLVWTQEGLREIEEIKVGEKVLSWDEKTREMSYQPVIELFRRNTTLLFDLETEYGTVIETTWNHPFWSRREEVVLADSNVSSSYGVTETATLKQTETWRKTKDLRVGDELLLTTGEWICVTEVREYIVETTKVYNIEVDVNHTYFVADGVLVHNYEGGAVGMLQGLYDKAKGLITGGSEKPGAKPVTIGSGGGKPGSEIVEDSNGKLYQRQTSKGKTEWVEINPATMNPARHAEGQALMAHGAANGDLAAYSKGVALTKGYGWDDNGLNMVGIRVPVDSQNARHDDYFLAVNKGKLEAVYFGSTQPGEKSYNGSAALGGVGEVSTGHRTIVIDDRRNGPDSWKNATLGRTESGIMTGARDKDANGNHSVTERAISALTNIGG